MAEPVSWFLIESGWPVVDSSGAEVGEVSSVIGDEDVDIFDGLHVRPPGGDERYVPATLVGPIEEGRVTIAAAFADLEPVPAAEEPGGAKQ
jgi:PRC-barrel domain